jgi:hypothetical protein
MLMMCCCGFEENPQTPLKADLFVVPVLTNTCVGAVPLLLLLLRSQQGEHEHLLMCASYGCQPCRKCRLCAASIVCCFMLYAE